MENGNSQDWQKIEGYWIDLKKIGRTTTYLKELQIGKLIELEGFLISEINSRTTEIYNLLSQLDLREEPYNYPPGVTHETQPDHWKKNTTRKGFNLKQLEYLLPLIQSELNSRRNTKPKTYNLEVIAGVFFNNGFEHFNYLDDNFLVFNNTPVKKYTILYYYLLEEEHTIFPNKSKYKTFVKEFCKGNLKGKDFAKLDKSNSSDVVGYDENLTYLRELSKEFKTISKK